MNSEFSHLVKDSQAYKQLDYDIRNGAFIHAYLLISGDKLALDLLIELLCIRLYCKNGGCMACPECSRVLKKSKPDIKEPNPDGGPVKVEEISDIVADTYLTAFEKGKKLYIIRDMENISEKAQNKLLKTLEEPCPNVHFIVTTASPQGILPTVVSRSKQVVLGAFKEADICSALKAMGQSEDDATLISRSAGGSITAAVRLMSDRSYFDKIDEFIDILVDINRSEDVVKHIMKPIFSGDNFAEVLDIAELVFHDIMYLVNGLPALALARRKERIDAIKAKYNQRCVAACLSEIARARQKIRANCNKTNVADSLLVSILEVRSKCKL